MHGGPGLTYSYAIRMTWLIGGRAQVRAFVRNCITCARARARPSTKKMGDLPSARINPSRPFSHTGLDYAGPFMLKASNRRGVASTKGYIAIFVCLCTKAIHIEVVGDLTTASFLAALRCFSSRRGTPAELWSDNATTFHGADAALHSMFREARHDQQLIQTDLANRGIRWRFIPPAAPHFGGLWEAAVKSAKTHLKKVVEQRLLTYEEIPHRSDRALLKLSPIDTIDWRRRRYSGTDPWAPFDRVSVEHSPRASGCQPWNSRLPHSLEPCSRYEKPVLDTMGPRLSTHLTAEAKMAAASRQPQGRRSRCCFGCHPPSEWEMASWANHQRSPRARWTSSCSYCTHQHRRVHSPNCETRPPTAPDLGFRTSCERGAGCWKYLHSHGLF